MWRYFSYFAYLIWQNVMSDALPDTTFPNYPDLGLTLGVHWLVPKRLALTPFLFAVISSENRDQVEENLAHWRRHGLERKEMKAS